MGRRNTSQKVIDFITFPFRALTLIETDRWGMSSLASERYDHVAREVTGYCLDIGCGKRNRFVSEFLPGNGKGIDIYPYEGLTEEHLVNTLDVFPFEDETFDAVTFIANLSHIGLKSLLSLQTKTWLHEKHIPSASPSDF